MSPDLALAVLSQKEVDALLAAREGRLYELFRRCALAVLTSGLVIDSARDRLAAYPDFEIGFEQVDRGIRLHLRNAPAEAFVDGVMIRGMQQHLFAVLRDLAFCANHVERHSMLDFSTPAGITDTVFHVLRHADLLHAGPQRGIAVCWGGHSIGHDEYEYSKEVGYQLGLRGLEICTGCGPGAMKGPMKGATIAHAKQRIYGARYIGITEPGIIAAEAPNPIVSDLVIMPDIEKRLEAFVRLGHGIVIFPGGVGTTEELLYLLGVLAHPRNAGMQLPVILTGPITSTPYLEMLDRFVRDVLGADFAARYEVVIGDARRVAVRMREGIAAAMAYRDANDDAAYFNWLLHVEEAFQTPFVPTHEAMARLTIDRALPPHELACNLRRAFSGLVSGNVKEEGIRAVEAHGPYQLTGDPALMRALDDLLRAFIAHGRMRLDGRDYQPCYELRS